MKVLIPFINNFQNPFVAELKIGLEKLGCDVLWDSNSFLQRLGEFDIILINWPEHISLEKISDLYLAELQSVLDYWQPRAKIVSVRHNTFPHGNVGAVLKSLYDVVFSHSDAIVHMGKFSQQEFLELYPDLKSLKHALIPHHTYPNTFPLIPDRHSARKTLGLSMSQKIVLVPGAIRNDEERILISDVANRLTKEGILLLVPSWRLQFISKKREPVRWLKAQLNFFFEKRTLAFSAGNAFISHKTMPIYFAASDLVLSIRLRNLNSGLVPTSFYFEKVVVGSDWGNGGELLIETGNPIFRYGNEEEITEAIHQAFILSNKNHGKRNKQFADANLALDKVSLQYLYFFRQLTDSEI